MDQAFFSRINFKDGNFFDLQSVLITMHPYATTAAAPDPDPDPDPVGTGNHANQKSILLFFYFFCVIAVFWTLKPLRTSSVVKAFGPDYYPLVKQGLVLLIPFVLVGYSVLVCRLDRLRLVFSITAGFVGMNIVMWTLFQTHPGNLLKMAFFYYIDTYITIMAVLFWTYLNDTFNTEEAKRHYGFIGAGGLVGGIFGSLISGWAGNMLGDNIILASTAFLLPIFPIVASLERYRSSPVIKGICPQGTRTASEVFLEGVGTVFHSRYLLGIVAIVGLYEIVSMIVDYQFTAALAESFASRHEMAAFQGKVFLTAQLLSLAVQVFITPWILRRFGVTTGLLFLPIVLITGSAAFLLVPALATITFAISAETSMSYSINQTSKEILYLPLDAVSKYTGKAFIDMFVLRAAKTIGAGILLTYTLFLKHHGVPASALTFVGIAALAVWIYVVLETTTHSTQIFKGPIPSPETPLPKPGNLSVVGAFSPMKAPALMPVREKAFSA